MKVVWILNSYGLDSGAITGSPIRFHAISSRWKRDVPDLAQTLMTTVGGERVLRSVGCTLPVVRVPASLLLNREPFKMKAFRLWSYFVTAIHANWFRGRMPNADVVITVSDYFCDVAAACVMRRRRPGTRWIAWIHHKELHPEQRPGNRLFNAITWRMQEWSFKKIAHFADQAWVLDSDAGDLCGKRLLELGMPRERIRKMQNGIDVGLIVQVPESGKKVDAVMIGVRPNKGSLDVVPVWKCVQAIRPGTSLLLMGGMAGEEALGKHIRKEGLDGVITILKPAEGWLPFDAYVRAIKSARFLFAPSHEEGWGIAVCEAMACGLPVVAYDLPVYRRVYGDALVAVPEGNPRAFAEAICRLLDDANRFSDYVIRGRDCAGKYDWDRVAQDDLAVAVGNEKCCG
jgi:glycosyltransferase involved in cell wall biosynthesis